LLLLLVTPDGGGGWSKTTPPTSRVPIDTDFWSKRSEDLLFVPYNNDSSKIMSESADPGYTSYESARSALQLIDNNQADQINPRKRISPIA
jgi:hypothetical protein